MRRGIPGRFSAGRILSGLGVGVAAFSLVVLGAGSALAASSVPYVDHNAIGLLSLCSQNGQPLTHGSVYDKPFVWKAIDSTAAVAPYNGKGASATLYAYQPRKGVDPRDWGGAQLSGASRFTNPQHPTAAMTGLDSSLALFLTNYHTEWDGLLQLRVYLGAPDEPISNLTYDAATIKVTGDTWKAVEVGSVPCSAGSAVSIEQILATSSAVAASLSAQTTESATPSSITGGKVAGPGGAATGSPTGPAATDPAASVTPTPTQTPVASASAVADVGGGGSGSDTLLWVLVGVAVLGGGFVAVQWIRSRA